LIIVIDNHDRLDTAHALKIWSTIRVFLELRKTEYKDKIWLLIPFDCYQLERVYEDDNKDELAKSFIEKTFHTSYRISPPVLSGWRDYFIEKLEKAFPNQDEKEYHRLYRVFNRYRISTESQVTPRQLIKYINKIGTINRQWGGLIPLSVQGIYILFESDLSKSGTLYKKLIEDRIIDQHYLQISDVKNEAMAKMISSMYYNLEDKDASQVLLEAPVLKSIENFDQSSFNSSIVYEGFSDVLEGIIENYRPEWLSSDILNLLNLAVLLGDTENIKATPAQTSSFWEHLCNWEDAEKVSVVYITNEIHKGLKYLIEKAKFYRKDEEIARKTINALSQVSLLNDKNEFNVDYAKKWIDATLESVKILSEYESIVKTLKVSGTESIYFNTISLTKKYFKSHPEELAKIKSENDIKKLLSFLNEMISKGEINERIPEAIEALYYTYSGWDVKGHIAVLHQRITQPNLNVQEVKFLFHLFFILRVVKNEVNLKPNSHWQQVLHYFVLRFNKSKDDQYTAMAYYYLILGLDDFDKYVNPINSNQWQALNGMNTLKGITNSPQSYPELIKELIENLNEASLGDSFVKMCYDRSRSQLFSCGIGEVVEGKKITSFISVDHFVRYYSFFNSHIEDSKLEQIIDILFSEENLVEIVISFKLDAPIYALTNKLILRDSKNESFIQHIKKYTAEIVRKDWLSAIKEQDSLFYIIYNYCSSDEKKSLELKSDFSDALMDYLKEIYKLGTYDDEELVDTDEWYIVVNALSLDHKETFLMNVRDFLLKEEVKEGTFKIFTLLNRQFQENKTFAERIDEAVRYFQIEIDADKDYGGDAIELINELGFQCSLDSACSDVTMKIMREKLNNFITLDEDNDPDVYQDDYENLSKFID
jgi:hypothetical protein